MGKLPPFRRPPTTFPHSPPYFNHTATNTYFLRPQHKPGNEQGKEAQPEFHAETYPPGTAPKEHTFRPDATYEAPAAGQPVEQPGWTSGDVHNAHGFEEGRPMEGQTSREQRGAHPGKRKKERSGLEGVGATGPEQPTVEGKVRQGAFDEDEAARGARGKSGREEGGLNWPGAEEREPARAEDM